MTTNSVRSKRREQLRRDKAAAKRARRQAPSQQDWRDAWQAGRRGERP
jgi:hypothetical protein